ncbi:MAG: ATP-binding cassette domain-containing protein [Phascolarctobacterium sp.]|nr:ATP-binding cassette domain-containing protein [Phascolarctobacterium sp.]
MSIFVDVEKNFGDFHLKVKFTTENEVLALLGASGSGKSMTLKCIAGIEKPDRGKIILDGVTLFDSEKHINLTPQERHTGLLFQNYALFPNMNVLENIEAGARREKNVEKRKELVNSIVYNFGLKDLLTHYPNQLSGGQQQRVALARILVSDPKVLLLDEPFSALDSHLRFRLEQEVREIIRQFAKPVILVSHDRDEVFRLSDKIAVMHKGEIETFGSKAEVFANPKTKQAALLTGCKNISPLEKINDNKVKATAWGIELELATPVDNAKYLGIRMHELTTSLGENSFACEVVEIIENPFSMTIMLKANPNAESFGLEVDKETWKSIESKQITISFPKEKISLLG